MNTNHKKLIVRDKKKTSEYRNKKFTETNQTILDLVFFFQKN